MAAFFTGAGLGLGAGISPGPLLTLVITATLERGFGAGVRVALAPFVTDIPIILATVLFLNALPSLFLDGVAGVGGLFVIYLGVATIRQAASARLTEIQPGKYDRDLWKGALVNILSPHPWLFWLSVGGPTVLQMGRRSPIFAAAFLVGFYGLLVGSKIVIAWGVASGRQYLSNVWYGRMLIGGGIMLVVLGGWLAVPAIQRMLLI